MIVKAVLPRGAERLAKELGIRTKGPYAIFQDFDEAREMCLLIRRFTGLSPLLLPPNRQYVVEKKLFLSPCPFKSKEAFYFHVLGDIPRNYREAGKMFLENVFFEAGHVPNFSELEKPLKITDPIQALQIAQNPLVTSLVRVKLQGPLLFVSYVPRWAENVGSVRVKKEFGPRAVYTNSTVVPLIDAVANGWEIEQLEVVKFSEELEILRRAAKYLSLIENSLNPFADSVFLEVLAEIRRGVCNLIRSTSVSGDYGAEALETAALCGKTLWEQAMHELQVVKKISAPNLVYANKV